MKNARSSPKLSSCGLLAGLLCAAFTSSSHAAPQSRPNVLVLYADDLGYGDLGCYNKDSKIPTPWLDRLAAEGVRFTDGHSSSGICTPSRYALLTGRYHWRKFHDIVHSFGESVFEPERLTLPELMRGAGYDTACIGKWHLGWDWGAIRKPDAEPRSAGPRPVWGPEAFDWKRPIPDGPLAHGFDHYFGDTVINFPPYAWIRDDRVVTAPDRMLDTSLWKPIKEGQWECRAGPMVEGWDPYAVLPKLTEVAAEYLRAPERGDKPFFLYFAFPAPHAPIIPNDRFDGASEAGAYGDFVVETDDCVGRLLTALEESGLADDTLVIFTADNGPERYAYARDAAFDHWSAAPFRGLKRDIYEGGHHVPFLVRWPGVVEPGRVSPALVSQIDLMATLAAVINTTLPSDQAEDSHDLTPLLRGTTDAVRSTHIHNTYAERFAIRHGDWLLIEAEHGYISARDADWEKKHRYPQDSDAPMQLFNLAHDPGQRENLADRNADRTAEMRALSRDLRERGHSAPRLESK